MVTIVLKVDGMTCDHCVNAVTKELKAEPQVRDVQIALVPGGVSTVTVSADDAIEPARLNAAIEEAGYDVVTA